MNKDTMKRVREAQKYKRMAVKALFPEKVAGHIDVIENELRKMVMEIIGEMVTEEMKSKCDSMSENKSSAEYKSTKTAKIEIS